MGRVSPPVWYLHTVIWWFVGGIDQFDLFGGFYYMLPSQKDEIYFQLNYALFNYQQWINQRESGMIGIHAI
jgi:hypothetical protein